MSREAYEQALIDERHARAAAETAENPSDKEHALALAASHARRAAELEPRENTLRVTIEHRRDSDPPRAFFEGVAWNGKTPPAIVRAGGRLATFSGWYASGLKHDACYLWAPSEIVDLGAANG